MINLKKFLLVFFLICTFFLSSCGNKTTKHNVVFHEFFDSTCSSFGNREYYECLDCHKYYSDNHETEISGVPIIEMKEHTLRKIDNNVGHFYSSACTCGYKECINTVPIVNINTLNGQKIIGNKDSSEYYKSTVSVSNCEEEYILNDIPAEVKVRGNYTANYDKKPYRIKFEDKQQMLGLNNDLKAKSWVLLAEYKDRSLLRNMTAFTLGNEILDEYTSDFRYVEVYVNDTYCGLYLLCEQQQVNKGRVNINEAKKDYEGIDIGYFVELDSYYLEEKEMERFEMDYHSLLFKDGTNCSNERFVKGYTIKSDIYSYEQRDFIQKTMNNIFEIAYSAVYTNLPFKTLDENNNIIDDETIKSPQEAINRVIDIESLVNVFILNEICLDMDLGWSSFFMYYDMLGNKKLTFTAPWDFDSALGYAVGETDILLSSYQYNSSICRSNTPKAYSNPWLLLFVNEEWFNNKVNNRWEEVKNTKEIVLENISFICNNYQTQIDKNYTKWPECNIFTEYLGCPSFENCTNHNDSTQYLKTYIINRFKYLDSVFQSNK